MRFEELRIRGFLSFGPDEQVVKLGKRGLVLIEGENRDDPTVANNGSGKSTLSEALLWGLFGKTLRGKDGDGVVHRKLRGTVGCKVTVLFSNDKGELFKVERHRGDPKEKNRLLFTGPSSGFTANETSATEAKIVEALGMDFETFTNAVVFGQGPMKHFANMTDKEMKQVTDKLIGVESLSVAYKLANKDLNDLEDELEVLENERKDLTSLKEDLQAAREEHTSWDDEYERNKAKYQKQIDALVEPDFKVLTKAIAEAEGQLTKADADLDLAKDVLAKKDAARIAAKLELERANEKQSNLTTKPGKCDHCGSKVAAEDLQAHRKKVEEEQAAAQGAYKTAREEYQQANTARDNKVSDRDNAKRKLEAARRKLDDAKSEAANHEKLRDMLKQFKQQTNPHVKAVERAEKALLDAKAHNAKVNAASVDVKKEIETLKFVATMFSDKGGNGLPPLKALLVESVAPFINKKLAHYSRFLTDGNIRLGFETQTQLKSGEYRDMYSLTAKNRHGSEDYGGSSGGERRKIDAAIFFAFQALAASRAREQVRFGLFDEIFDALDETAQEVMMELLLEEQKRRDTIFVITQRADLASFFPTRVRVVKEHGFSTISQKVK